MPMWLGWDDLARKDVRPAPLVARLLAAGPAFLYEDGVLELSDLPTCEASSSRRSSGFAIFPAAFFGISSTVVIDFGILYPARRP